MVFLEPLFPRMEELSNGFPETHGDEYSPAGRRGGFEVSVVGGYGKLWGANIPGPLVHAIHK